MRLFCAAAAAALITAALIPVQWLALRLNAPLRRATPVAYHRMMCRLLGLRLEVRGTLSTARPLLIVSNHVSWMDICAVSSLLPGVFVAKSEVARWPIVGLLARLQRSAFVDRTRRQRTPDTTGAIAQRLCQGDIVVLFAEGTSSDGNRVLPFRSALLGALEEASIHTPITVQALALTYTGWRGFPAGRRQRPHLAWYGDMDMLPHLADILRHGAVDAVASWGTPAVYRSGSDRKGLARALESEVRELAVLGSRAAG